MFMAAALASLLVFTSTAPAHALYYSGGVGSTAFSVRITGVNSTWTGYWQSGITAWNNTAGSTGVAIGQNSSSPRTLTAGNYADSWLGLYSPSGTRTNRTFLARANATRISQMTGSNFATWARFTTTHELGHALSLGDNPQTSAASIMKYIASSATPFTTPRAFDIQRVIEYY